MELLLQPSKQKNVAFSWKWHIYLITGKQSIINRKGFIEEALENDNFPRYVWMLKAFFKR